jgi:hypothetical protein
MRTWRGGPPRDGQYGNGRQSNYGPSTREPPRVRKLTVYGGPPWEAVLT